jgi:ribose transport system substrate-binding protein
MSNTLKTKIMLGVSSAVLSLALIGAAHAQEEHRLDGKTIGITAVGTDHDWDLLAYQAQIEEIERLGGTAIALDAGRNDQTQISQIQTLIAQQPDAIIEQLGNLDVLNPWLQRINDAGIPLFTVDTATPLAINNATSNNYGIGSDLALQIVQDMGGTGKIALFNGFTSVPVCKIRIDQLKYVLQAFPEIEIIDPELRDVIPNTVQQAYNDTTDILTRYGADSGLKAVVACWDVPMVGATQAIEAAGRTDVSADYVAMVADPNSPAGAVAAQQPAEIGRAAVHAVAAHLAGEEVAPFTMVPAVLITKANAAETAGPFLPK